jgi:hypothetical protein
MKQTADLPRIAMPDFAPPLPAPITTTTDQPLVVVVGALDTNPAAVYLASLTASSRRTMRPRSGPRWPTATRPRPPIACWPRCGGC